jgi:isopenicillin-N N-acyltransferase-like protein
VDSYVRVLDLEGPPRELGRAHGEAARTQVASNVAMYLRWFERDAGLARAEVLARAGRYLAVIDRRWPEYGEMMRGVAEAAALDLAEVVALNVRYEILYSELARARRQAGPGCTAFAALPDVSADGHLLMGQNWDWRPEVEGILLRIRRQGDFRLLCFTESGIVGGKIGLNSAGVGLAINGLFSEDDSWAALGTPFHVRTWSILNGRRWPDALAAVRRGVRSCSANFLIGQGCEPGRGEAVSLEAAPRATYAVEPRRGLLAHTNHFLSPDRAGAHPAALPGPGTFQRLTRLRDCLDERRGRLDPAAAMAVLRDHAGYPDSICAHCEPDGPDEDRYETVFSAVLDLHEGEMLAAAGPPCQSRYLRVRLFD